MLLGLDLASRLTGWACGDGAAVPLVGAWEFGPVEGDYGLLLSNLNDYLDVAHRRFAFTHVGVEAPIFVPGDKLSKLRLLYPLPAFVAWWCRERGITFREYTVQAVKQAVGGSAHAGKPDMVHVARKCGLELPPGPGEKDAADAFGVWILMLREFAPAHSRRWDTRLFSPRGALL